MSNTHKLTRISKPEKKSLPAGAIVISKEVTITVKEIENGFIISKRTEYRYTKNKNGDSYGDWLTVEKEWYSATDPIEVTTKDKSLADVFN